MWLGQMVPCGSKLLVPAYNESFVSVKGVRTDCLDNIKLAAWLNDSIRLGSIQFTPVLKDSFETFIFKKDRTVGLNLSS